MKAKYLSNRILFLLALITLNLPLGRAFAQSTAFTYQGRLNDASGPATGLYDLAFTLYTDPTNGYAVGWGAITNAATPVTNGLFTVTLNFGYGVFDGTERWLELAVQPAGGTNFTTLVPRQAISPAPLASYAAKAGSAITANVANQATFTMNSMNATYAYSAGSVQASGVMGVLSPSQLPDGLVTNGASGVTLAGTFAGDGSGLTNLPIALPPAGILTNNASDVHINGTFVGQSYGSFVGEGSGLYNLNASQLISGTVPDARLAGNVARLNATNQIFTGTNNYSGVLLATNANNVLAGSFTGSGAGLTLLNGGALAAGSVGNPALAEASVTADKLAAGQVVKSVNGLHDNVALTAGANIVLTPNGNSLQISAAGAAAPWSLTGNSGTSPTNGNFLGTTDNQPLELRVNGMRALSMVSVDGFADPYNYWYGVCNLAGGSPGNWIAPGVIGSVIAGGGSLSHLFQYSFISSDTNAVSASFSFLGGGLANSIQSNARNSVMGGGAGNTIQTNAGYSFLGGGLGNAVGAQCAMVPGGDQNYAGGFNSFAAGHRAKAIYAGDFVWADSQDADFNATDKDQFSVRASGGVRVVTAGAGMTIDGLPVLAGTVADAQLSANVARLNASQTFTGTNCFNGRVGIGISNPGFALDVSGAMRASIIYDADNQNYYVDPSTTSLLNDVRVSICYDRADTSYYLQPHSVSMLNTMNASTIYAGVVYDKANPGYYLVPSGTSICSDLRANIFYDRADTSYYLQPHSSTVLNLVRAGKVDVCNPSGTTTITLNGTNGTVTALTLTQTSDRNAKENFRPVDAQEVLGKVASLPLSRWNYKQDAISQHIGPMAQDFYAAFNVGPDDKHITTVDESGVALAAIQGLNQKLEATRAENAALKQQNDSLAERLRQLESAVKALGERK